MGKCVAIHVSCGDGHNTVPKLLKMTLEEEYEREVRIVGYYKGCSSPFR